MPELPELYIAAKTVRKLCADVTFSGNVEKSDVSKNPSISWSSSSYKISAESRGKEMSLLLEDCVDCEKRLRILFRFGMSGRFEWTRLDQIHKHSHLRFFESKSHVLSFVDTRRFGTWEVSDGWGEKRGPCPVTEYLAFRSHVLNLVQNQPKLFQGKAICEIMHEQQFFNGIGNYLRAEILYRAGIPPFRCACEVLSGLKEKEPKEGDFLSLCHTVPQEVIDEDFVYNGDEDYAESRFSKWIQCYMKPGMKNLVDRQKRTIWFHGEAGPLAPASEQSRHKSKKPPQTKDTAGKSKMKIKKEEVVRVNSEEVKVERDKVKCEVMVKTEPTDEVEHRRGKRKTSVTDDLDVKSKRVKRMKIEIAEEKPKDKGGKTKLKGQRGSEPEGSSAETSRDLRRSLRTQRK